MAYTTNLIERTIKEIRKRVKVIGALSSVSAVEEFVYLRVAMLNDRWSNRVVNGFLEAREEIQEVLLMAYTELLIQPRVFGFSWHTSFLTKRASIAF